MYMYINQGFSKQSNKMYYYVFSDFENVMLSLRLTGQKKNNSPANIHVQKHSTPKVFCGGQIYGLKWPLRV